MELFVIGLIIFVIWMCIVEHGLITTITVAILSALGAGIIWGGRGAILGTVAGLIWLAFSDSTVSTYTVEKTRWWTGTGGLGGKKTLTDYKIKKR